MGSQVRCLSCPPGLVSVVWSGAESSRVESGVGFMSGDEKSGRTEGLNVRHRAYFTVRSTNATNASLINVNYLLNRYLITYLTFKYINFRK